MSYALFINRNDIIKNTPLQGAIDADALLPFMRTSQDKYLKNLLGTVLFGTPPTNLTLVGFGDGLVLASLQTPLVTDPSSLPVRLPSSISLIKLSRKPFSSSFLSSSVPSLHLVLFLLQYHI